LKGDGDVPDRAVVAYLAKYATKSTETTGHVSKRLTGSPVDYHADTHIPPPAGWLTHAVRWAVSRAGGACGAGLTCWVWWSLRAAVPPPLRRTDASLRDLMQRISHDSTAAAIRYQHASREAEEAIAAAIEDVIKRTREDGDDGPAGALVPSGT
jgi:hypothetical protein